ncbi:MAG: SRPBCC family protein [Bacteroidales bacterium]|jgi:hypothetical protein|nr:SRPBCC family protein [Bacteroidales bacterium]
MTAHYTSKHGQVAKRPEELFMAFTDMRNFAQMVPQDKVKAEITADFDNLTATVQGFRIGVRVDERQPYRLIRIGSSESPVEFVGVLHFEPSTLPGRTDFWIDLDANLNFMMKTMLGSKLQQVIDKMVDSLVDASEGRMPQMPDDFHV